MTSICSSARVAVVTAANSRYFGLLDGLLDSLADALLPTSWRQYVLDVGLQEDQRYAIKQRGVTIVEHDWCLEFPGRDAWDTENRWFKAMVNRPFLPDVVPGGDIYLWIDCDAWVQNAASLHQLVDAATREQAIALVIQRFGRSVNLQVAAADGEQRVVSITEKSIRQNVARCYEACFGPQTVHHADGLITNSGVFAVAGDSPAWRAWQSYLVRGLHGGVRHTLVEQQALNLACLESAIRYIPMPCTCDWNITTLQPAWSSGLAALVDPDAPGDPIGVLHLTDLKDQETLPVQDFEGRPRALPLRYQQFKRWRESVAVHGVGSSEQTGHVGRDAKVSVETHRIARSLQDAALHRQATVVAELRRTRDLVVMSGPFSGMRLPDEWSWSLGKGPTLLGCYESELHPWIEQAIRRQPALVVNVGCSEGYYAVGLARRLPKSRVVAFDADERARLVCKEAGRINNVHNLEIRGICDPEALANLVAVDSALAIVDIEGAEQELFPRSCLGRLRSTDLIIECHEFASPGITHHLAAMFDPSHLVEHTVEKGRDPNAFDALARLSSLDRWLAVCEFRPCRMNWLAAWSRQQRPEP